MLFKDAHLKQIRIGTVSLAFRRWDKCSVKNGSLVKTSVGLIDIVDVAIINEADVSEDDVSRSGFETKEELFKSLRPGKNLYRIEVRYHSEDPRIALREQRLTAEKYGEVREKLERLDRYSKQGDWTKIVLRAIWDNPCLKAVEIAKLTGFEKEWLKLNIRKLKNLGLTISHNVGYELSPLGSEVVERLLLKGED